MIAEFAEDYRLMEMRQGRPNPGNLCGVCAGNDTAKRIHEETVKGMVAPKPDFKGLH